MNVRGLILLSLLVMNGCSSVRDAFVQDQMYLRNSREAQRKFRELHQQATPGLEHPDHFRDGFHDGYVGVAMGASGCPPTLPPKQYWQAKYRSAEGKLVVTAWYNGYAEGALAANSSNAANRNRVHTALDVYGLGKPIGMAEAGTAVYAPILSTTPDPTPLTPEGFPPPAPGAGHEFLSPLAPAEPAEVDGFGLSRP